MQKLILFLFLFLVFLYSSYSTTWQVGLGKTYTKPSQVSSLAKNGDTVEIDAGTYSGDVCYWGASDLRIIGLGGFAKLQAAGKSYGGKAIWVIGGNNVTVEYIEFSDCTVIDQNGAGIRFEGKNLNVRNCYFHNNDDGIVCGAMAQSSMLIEYTEFAYNGFGDGYSHNLYIGHIDTLIFRFNYTHNAKVGHELKSRANVNIILNNRFSDEADGTASRNIDLPNGGTALIIGNIIEQGPQSQNSNIIGYGLEGLSNTSAHDIYISHNTFVNNLGKGSFIQVQNSTNLVYIYNNILAGAGTVLVGNASSLDSSNNLQNNSISFFKFKDEINYDFNILANSPAIDKGNISRINYGFSLIPFYEYLHPHYKQIRNINCPVDIGAFEFPKASGGILYISGKKSVCDISTLYYYSVQKQDSPIVWNVYGGTIIGDGTLDSVKVQWKEKGIKEIKIIRNALSYCADSVSTFVKIGEPVFTKQNIDICFGDTINKVIIKKDTLIQYKFISYIGCDSTVDISYKVTLPAKYNKFTKINAGDIYQGKKYDSVGTFQIETIFPKSANNGCDSILIDNIKVIFRSGILD